MTNPESQEYYFGPGVITKLEKILERLNPKKIFLVTGKSSFAASGAEAALTSLAEKYQIHRFNDFTPNPKLKDIRKGIKEYKEFQPDVVIAVGGGSTIDVAKACNIFVAQNDDDYEAYIKKQRIISKPGKPFIAIPTTAGTGSEATHFAVIYINKTKYSLAHTEFILPDISIVDPELIASAPKKVRASAALDVLSQAIESFWSVHSTEESRQYVAEAIQLLIPNIVKAIKDKDQEAIIAVTKAANLAGKGINISKTTASHALSYTLTSLFGVPHGHAAIITVPAMLEFNSTVTKADLLDRRGLEFAQERIKELVSLIGASSVAEAKASLEQIIEEVGLENRLENILKSRRNLELVVQGLNLERAKNNPRRLTKKNLQEILNSIW